VIRRCGAPREGQFRERERGGDSHIVWRETRPDRVQRSEPIEETDVLRPWYCPRERLIEVVVRVDQSREDDVSGQVQNLVGCFGKILRATDLFYEPIDGKQTAIHAAMYHPMLTHPPGMSGAVRAVEWSQRSMTRGQT